MNRMKTIAALFLVFALGSGVALASWYDDYDAGLAAVKKGNWNAAIQKMTAAIKGNPKESDKARTYGVIVINYHPYYYRGVALMNVGRYEEAIADFEKTSGPGPENLGSLDVLMERAKKQLAAAEAEPEPAPSKPEPARPATAQQAPAPVPAGPQVDPALRQRAAGALAGAKQRLQAAQQRRATGSPQYASAMSMYTDAMSRSGSARSNDELNAIITMADNAGDLADLAMAPSAAAPSPAMPGAVTSKPAIATENVLSGYRQQLRTALGHYFNGDFEEAATAFESLSRQLPNNAWIYAFLGASQYSRFAFEGEQKYRESAMRSFQKAKRLRSWKGGLPRAYFSSRIRKAFDETSG